MARILIVDDDANWSDMLTDLVESLSHDVRRASTCDEALHAAFSDEFDVVLLDVRLPDGSGLDLIPQLRTMPAAPEIIIMTGAGNPDGAELAIRSGAWDYLEKAASIQGISLQLRRALQFREGNRQIRAVALKTEGIVGRSAELRLCLDMMAQAASNDTTVLFTGETGTGKELFARALHENSARSNGNFAIVDCATLPASLIESTLFGHLKGAFTGADQKREGLIKHADGGTLFLDEVGELPLSLQKSFLRVLQERRFRPVGGQQELCSDFRLVAATNRNLDELVQQGEFREDLLFRIRAFEVVLPPLRNRPEDVKDLILYHSSRICERRALDAKGISPEFFEVMMKHDWPGNVRELVSALERAIAASEQSPTLFPRHLPSRIRVRHVRKSLSGMRLDDAKKASHSATTSGALPSLKDFRTNALADLERSYLRELMKATESDLQRAREVAGVSRQHLHFLLTKHEIERQM